MKTGSPVSLRIIALLAFIVSFLPNTASAVAPQIATGRAHTVVLMTNGTVWAWGQNDYGQLCDPTRGLKDSTPAPIPLTTDAIAVAAFDRQTLVVKSDGSLWGCGENYNGGLGVDSGGANVPNLTQALPASSVNTTLGGKAIATGTNHTLAIKPDGTVMAFGRGVAGQLGDGLDTSSVTPVAVTGLTNIIEVSAGESHSMALDSNGKVYVWGQGSFGQLGFGTDTTDKIVPAQIMSLSLVTSIEAGTRQSFAVTSNGTVYAWGVNSQGQLGDGTRVNSNLPIQILAAGSLVKEISSKSTHTLAIKSDSTVFGWGKDSPYVWNNTDNTFDSRGTLGQGGSGTTIDTQLAPYNAINWGSTVVSIQAGYLFTAALLADNTLLAAGENSLKQLGDGSLLADFRTTPTPVKEADGITPFSVYRDLCTDPTDTDNDGTADCNELCPNDINKLVPGTCGCGVADTDSDLDGTPDCIDTCFNDPNKTDPLVCGCGTPDTDSDNDGTPNCNDTCPTDPAKTAPGTCGCGFSDADSDGDGVLNCQEVCDFDPLKTDPGVCGCGQSDIDTDGDGVLCDDNCPAVSNPLQTDTDLDGSGDACDLCIGNDTSGDPDADSYCSDTDNCQYVANSGQEDADGDLIGDACDACYGNNASGNSDSDAFCNDADTCPDDPQNDIDADGICAGPGFSLPKTAGNDNCPNDANPGQGDADGDGIGDACEPVYPLTSSYNSVGLGDYSVFETGTIITTNRKKFTFDTTNNSFYWETAGSDTVYPGTYPGPTTNFTYLLAADNSFTVNGTTLHGNLSTNSQLFVLGDYDLSDDSTMYEVGVQEATAMSAASLSGNYMESLLTVDRLVSGTDSTFRMREAHWVADGAGGISYDFMKDTFAGTPATGLTSSYTVQANGEFSQTGIAEDKIGYLSPDGELLVIDSTNDDITNGITHSIVVRMGTGMANSSLNGTYAYHKSAFSLSATMDNVFSILTFNGAGAGTYEDHAKTAGPPESGSFNYTVDPVGKVAFTGGYAEVTATVSSNGEYLVLCDYTGDADGFSHGIAIKESDACPADPLKTSPGACGCGNPDTDSDFDGTADCIDLCVSDPGKIDPGTCGCGIADTDSDSDGTPDCNDACDFDPAKTVAGLCGCGQSDTDDDLDGVLCNDNCPAVYNPAPQGDADADGVGDACDICIGFDDNADADGDGVADGCDVCPGFADSTDTDLDGIPDGCDNCPLDSNADQADLNTNGIGDICEAPACTGGDADGDTVLDSCDVCPGFNDLADADGDGVPDGCDICEGFPDSADDDADGVPNACDYCVTSLPIRIAGGNDHYQALQLAYEDNTLESPGTIQIQSSFVGGPLLLNLAKDVTIKGGCDCNYGVINSGPPSIIESLTIDGPSGSVTVDNILIQ